MAFSKEQKGISHFLSQNALIPLDKMLLFIMTFFYKSRIRETKHLSIDAESSTDSKQIQLVRQKLQKNRKILRSDFTPFISNSFLKRLYNSVGKHNVLILVV